MPEINCLSSILWQGVCGKEYIQYMIKDNSFCFGFAISGLFCFTNRNAKDFHLPRHGSLSTLINIFFILKQIYVFHYYFLRCSLHMFYLFHSSGYQMQLCDLCTQFYYFQLASVSN